MLILVFAPAAAADRDGAFLFYNDVRCDKVVADARKKITLAHRQWLSGWFSAYNMFAEDTYSLAGQDRELAAQWQWLLLYCQTHEETMMSEAVKALVKAFHPHRQKRK